METFHKELQEKNPVIEYVRCAESSCRVLINILYCNCSPLVLEPDSESRWGPKSSCPMPKDTGNALVYIGEGGGEGSSSMRAESSHDTSYPHGTEVRFDCVPEGR